MADRRPSRDDDESQDTDTLGLPDWFPVKWLAIGSVVLFAAVLVASVLL